MIVLLYQYLTSFISIFFHSMNAPVTVDIAGETDPLKIAQKELRERKIPMVCGIMVLPTIDTPYEYY